MSGKAIRKIGTEEILTVSTHGKGFYLKLSKNLVDAFGLRPGDKLRVEVKELLERNE